MSCCWDNEVDDRCVTVWIGEGEEKCLAVLG